MVLLEGDQVRSSFGYTCWPLSMTLVSSFQFLSRLTLMFDKARTKGHVDLVMKRCEYMNEHRATQKPNANPFFADDGRTKPTPREEGAGGGPSGSKAPAQARKTRTSSSSKSRSESTSHDGSEYMCLIRARLNGDKISTVVSKKNTTRQRSIS